jgi:exosortase
MRATEPNETTPTAASAPEGRSQISAPSRLAAALTVRNAGFLAFVVATVVSFWPPLSTVIGRSLGYREYEHYSHIILVPLMTLFVLYVNRQAVFSRVRYACGPGTALLAIGVALGGVAAAGLPALSQEAYLSLTTLSAMTLVMGGFLFCYGVLAFREAAFALSLLLLMVPLPAPVLSGIVRFLQVASAEASYLLFTLTGIPILREGLVFALPGLTIEVAEECSGIRSSLALFITGLMVAYFSLQSNWTRTALMVAVIPLAVVKNAIRIVVLSLLAVHVDPAFITGRLHRQGGMVFFLVTLVLMAGVVWVLRRAEGRLARGVHAT